MIVSYSIMIMPMYDIWVIGHVIGAYSVMVIPIDDIRVIGQCGSFLWCHGNTHG